MLKILAQGSGLRRKNDGIHIDNDVNVNTAIGVSVEPGSAPRPACF